jgi:hypothetical protein
MSESRQMKIVKHSSANEINNIFSRAIIYILSYPYRSVLSKYVNVPGQRTETNIISIAGSQALILYFYSKRKIVFLIITSVHSRYMYLDASIYNKYSLF